ncbi:hydrogenase maturation protease [Pseudonocardia bannensis]|uniref:Hydrogenase maturation protease n=1 Tax=Pseudonocardia bannensis TaxID=630973 RepID=A0A848DJ79_9PSEU|nr:hydrogenase maturation protease [Pseudonocardia bannensis]
MAGVGNVFLSDDGFGVEVAQRLLVRGGLPEGAEVADIGIRGVHLAYQLLDGYDGLVLVDAVPRGGPPGTIYRLEHDLNASRDGTEPGAALDGHGMDPATVLALLAELAAANGVARPVRRVLVVGCQPAVLDEGMGLSEPVAAAVEPALHAVDELVGLLLGSTVRRAAQNASEGVPS